MARRKEILYFILATFRFVLNLLESLNHFFLMQWLRLIRIGTANAAAIRIALHFNHLCIAVIFV